MCFLKDNEEYTCVDVQYMIVSVGRLTSEVGVGL